MTYPVFMPQIQKMHSVQEVAEILGVHYMTARNWCVEGRIKAQKIGRMWRISDDELRRIVNEGLDPREGDDDPGE